MIYIIGLGCHSEVIYSILTWLSPSPSIQFLSYPSVMETQSFPELIQKHYKGGIDTLSQTELTQSEFIIGIGDNRIRQQIANHYPNLIYINAIHPKSTLGMNLKIGVGNVICPGAVIQTGTDIGNHNIINTHASIDHHGSIRNYCHLAPSAVLCGNVTLYDGVFVAVGCSVIPQIKIKPWSMIKANTLVKTSTAPIPIYEPDLEKYKHSALNAINSGWVSSLGQYVDLATNKLKSILHAPYVILTNNGTSATHCLFLALKYQHPEITKIYVPNNVYVAVWNTALMEYLPNQVEVMKINAKTWNMETSTEYLQSLDTNSAVLVVHNLGNIVNIPRLKRIRPDLVFIEDNCEGLFGQYDGVYTGTSPSTLATSISFFGNKTITCGEGGAVLVNDLDLYNYLYKVCHQGNTATRYIHDVLGYNYRITNIQAGFLYDQFCDFQAIINRKQQIFDQYQSLLTPLVNTGKICLQTIEPETQRANWMFTIQIPNNSNYNQFQTYMNLQGIDTRPFFYPMTAHQHLHEIKLIETDLPNQLQNECMMLPSSPTLTLDEQSYIVECIRQYIR